MATNDTPYTHDTNETPNGTLYSVFLAILAALMLGALWLVVLTLSEGQAHGASIGGTKHDNSLGVVVEYSNPYSYLFGNIVSVPQNPNRVERDSKGRVATILTVQPAFTFELYTEEVVFCGNRASDFREMVGPIVIVYKRVAHEQVSGVACHELEGVFHVTAEEAQ